MSQGKKNTVLIAGALSLLLLVAGCSAMLEARELDPPELSSPPEPSSTTEGEEHFVYGEILSVDGLELEIEQHMDAGSKDVGGRVTMATDVRVYANRGDREVPASRSDLLVGHVVGMNIGADGQAYRLTFDDIESCEPVEPAHPIDPTQEEIFVYFEILGLDLDERLIHIEQHMDPDSVEVDSRLRLAGDVEVFTSGRDGETPASLEDLRVGQSGGLILYGRGNLKGLVHKIIVDADGSIAPSDPSEGEIFIYGEVLRVDGQTLHIEQHMDSGSVDVGGQVTMADNVVIRRSVDDQPLTPMEPAELEQGDLVGMIRNADGLIRAIIVE
ncbi:MAG: hypothetical protein R6U70_05635 [Bacillota bacterium]